MVPQSLHTQESIGVGPRNLHLITSPRDFDGTLHLPHFGKQDSWIYLPFG